MVIYRASVPVSLDRSSANLGAPGSVSEPRSSANLGAPSLYCPARRTTTSLLDRQLTASAYARLG